MMSLINQILGAGMKRSTHCGAMRPALLVGDFLLSRSFEMMIRVDSMLVMALLAQATTAIAEGEVLQLLNINNPATSEEDYLKVIFPQNRYPV